MPGEMPPPRPENALDRDIDDLMARVVEEATTAVGMFESALEALWSRDGSLVDGILARDDKIDAEEVAIEQACLRVMTLRQPVAGDFRTLAFVLKVNTDVERVADHACSIAKASRKLCRLPEIAWPESLRELGQRVPMACHGLLKALVVGDADQAIEVVRGDAAIDALFKRLFKEIVEIMGRNGNSPEHGLLLYRIGRELERIGDLMTNIAEDIIYLRTGEIVRHEVKKPGNAGDASTPPATA